MKYRYIIIKFFVFLFVVNVNAQQYEPPSREQVQRILDELEECKDILNEAETYLEQMEDNPEEVTLKTYKDTQRLIENVKGCIADRQKNLMNYEKSIQVGLIHLMQPCPWIRVTA